MNNNPLVSVVVTCYNHEKYIAECLKSIFSQTYTNIQLIIMNDGSTDKSGEIIESLISQSPYVNTQYYYQKNSGICVARNNSFKHVSGKFLLFVDSDNYLDNNYIELMVIAAEKNNADLIYTDLRNVDTKELYLEAQQFELQSFLTSNYIDSCSLIRKDILKNAKYDLYLNRKKLEDYDFFLNLILNNKAKPLYISGTKLNYRVLSDSLSRKTSEKYYFEVYLYVLNKYLKNYEKEVMTAIKANIFNLEDRLTDLINHLGDVTTYVHNLEDRGNSLQNTLSQTQQLKNQLESQKRELEDSNQKITEEKVNLEQQLVLNNNLLEATRGQYDALLNSRDYILGKKLLRPLRVVKRVKDNPRIIKSYGKRGVNKFVRFKNSLPKPTALILEAKRNFARKKNNYSSPKRVLVYVIYESESRLQEYKLIFLKELAKISDRVLIVVNGSLPQADLDKLNKFGKVEIRSNEGYDTAAFRYGILSMGKKIINEYDELLLVNDTNVGPLFDLTLSFNKMAEKKLDFWGIAYGEKQPDFTGYNKYKYIPIHLQSFFLVIEKSMFSTDDFYDYWEKLSDTNSREKAIGRHETVFTKHFADLGFKHGALAEDSSDSAMYLHPLRIVEDGVPLVKLTAFYNYNDDKFTWQGLQRKTEVPDLLYFIEAKTNYPMSVINDIMESAYHKKYKEHILIIDGVENAIPQCTRYRVLNKAEQLRKLGFDVWTVNLSDFQMGYAEHASHIIIYRAPNTDKLVTLIDLAKKENKAVLYDIDDLVIDTKYTNSLSYTQGLSKIEKENYDRGVNSYHQMMLLCDGVISSTEKMKKELLNYKSLVLLNRNVASQELVDLSISALENKTFENKRIKIGYFSGSITHNENFELIKPAIKKILEEFPEVELHLVGHLSLPDDMKKYEHQLSFHDYVEWHELPKLIAEVDINLAPLVDSIFNEAKSEIKWIEAALVKVPTVASDIGSFREMIQSERTGLLVADDEWYDVLKKMIINSSFRNEVAENAWKYVNDFCTTNNLSDEFTVYINKCH